MDEDFEAEDFLAGDIGCLEEVVSCEPFPEMLLTLSLRSWMVIWAYVLNVWLLKRLKTSWTDRVTRIYIVILTFDLNLLMFWTSKVMRMQPVIATFDHHVLLLKSLWLLRTWNVMRI